jgi:hypothetical protein
MASITHILTSPLRRTLETAFVSFQPVYDRGLRAITWGDLKEWGYAPCNIGAPVQKLQEQMPCLPLELRALTQGWEHEEDFKGDRVTRAELVRKELYVLAKSTLRGRDWKGIPMKETGHVEILIVSHGSFLSSLMGSKGKSQHCFRCCCCGMVNGE